MDEKEILKIIRNDCKEISWREIREFQKKFFDQFSVKGNFSKSIDVMPKEVVEFGYRKEETGYWAEETIYFDTYQNLYKNWLIFKKLLSLKAFK